MKKFLALLMAMAMILSLAACGGSKQETPAQSATRDMDERQDLERQCYIDAVVRLLKKADLRKVDLVWVYASHLIKGVNGRAE